MNIRDKTKKKSKSKILKQSFIFATLFLSLCTTPIFAFDYDEEEGETKQVGDFTITTFNEKGLAESGYYHAGPKYSGTMSESIYDYLVENRGKTYADKTKATGKLVYKANGYGGPYGTCGKTYFDTEWSFRVLLPYTALNTPIEIEKYAYNYIPLNNKYNAGSMSQSAYGYAAGINASSFPNIPKGSYDGKYTLKYVAANPKTGAYYQDTSGHILMATKTKDLGNGDYKPFFGEYRFNGISGNGERMMQQAA